MKKITAICDSVTKVVNIGIILFFLSLIVSCVTQVFSRYIMNDSFRWTEELARYSFIWVHFLGSTICVRKKSHATITILGNSLPPAGQKILGVFVAMILLITSVVLVYGGIKMAQMTANQMNVGIKIPMSVVYISASFSGAVNILYIIELVATDIRDLVKKQTSSEEALQS